MSHAGDADNEDELLTGEAGAAFSNLPGGQGGWLHQLIIFAAR